MKAKKRRMAKVKRRPCGKKPRATDATIQQRIQEVLQIRIDGAEGWDVRLYVAEKEKAGEEPWKIEPGGEPLSERRIREYVQAADKLIEDSCRTKRRQAIRRHKAQRRSLYARAVGIGDFRTALAVLSDLAMLEGLYPPKKVKAEHTGTMKTDVTSGGKPLDRNSLTPADIAAAAALVGMAGVRVPEDGGPQSVDSAHAASQTAGLSAAL